MASQSSQWKWDDSRQEYFYWESSEGCWVYQSGSKLYPPQAETPRHSGPELTSIHGRTTSHDSTTTVNYSLSSTANSTAAVNYGLSSTANSNTTAYYGVNSAANSSVTKNYDLSSAFNSLAVAEVPQTIYGAYGFNADHVQRKFEAPPTVPRENITDPKLQQRGIFAAKKLLGTTETEERLDPRYKVQERGRRFFVVGRVFRMLWPELAGDSVASSMTTCSGHYGAHVYTKIRYFVVIRPSKFDCACLPIQTYGNQGVAKTNLRKNDHAIIYTGSKAPRPAEAEKPSAHNEPGMRPPIRVVGSRGGRLDSMSRVNYHKIYTVEHNVKVFELGKVHKDALERLVSNWNDVWQWGSGSASSTAAHPRASITQIVEKDEEEDEESTEGEEEVDGAENDETQQSYQTTQ